jgi:hypothetical protein
MGSRSDTITGAMTQQTEAQETSRGTTSNQSTSGSSEHQAALEWLEKARERFLSASIAFCDGSISEGQLRAARELLREWEARVIQLEAGSASPFTDETSPLTRPTPLDTVSESTATPEQADDLVTHEEVPPELRKQLNILDKKITRLERDFQNGKVNASQYRAIRRHYLGQREVAVRLRKKHPDSDRWKNVLEEGKTSFLMQLNEAACHSVGFYENKARGRIFQQGIMPQAAEEAMALLGTFGTHDPDSPTGPIFATQIEDGSALLLIPGRFTSCLSVYSQSPPAWQVRALREVHRNFEAANRSVLQKQEFDALVFPDLSRFVKK